MPAAREQPQQQRAGRRPPAATWGVSGAAGVQSSQHGCSGPGSPAAARAATHRTRPTRLCERLAARRRVACAQRAHPGGCSRALWVNTGRPRTGPAAACSAADAADAQAKARWSGRARACTPCPPFFPRLPTPPFLALPESAPRSLRARAQHGRAAGGRAGRAARGQRRGLPVRVAGRDAASPRAAWRRRSPRSPHPHHRGRRHAVRGAGGGGAAAPARAGVQPRRGAASPRGRLPAGQPRGRARERRLVGGRRAGRARLARRHRRLVQRRVATAAPLPPPGLVRRAACAQRQHPARCELRRCTCLPRISRRRRAACAFARWRVSCAR